jgi:hypothetical protein
MMTGGALREKGERGLRAVIRTLLLLRQIGNAAICAITCQRYLTVGSFFRIAAYGARGSRPQVADVPYFVANTYRCSDRAAVQTTAILQIFETAPPQDRRQEIENYLRDEISDAMRQAIVDREPNDE